jgi:hypothetical protein
VAPRAIFVFGRDNDCSVFRRAEDAAGELEAPDVEDDEYVAFDDGGTVYRLWATGLDVHMEPTPERDEAQLRARLRRFLDDCQIDAPNDDMIAIANAVLRANWDMRWPKRPRWLADRLHGATPPTLE